MAACGACVACTWGGYEPSDAGFDAAGVDSFVAGDVSSNLTQTLIDSSGGTATSSDGFFHVRIPAGAFVVPTYVLVGAKPTVVSETTNQGNWFGTSYAVALQAIADAGQTAQLWKAISYEFELKQSGYFAQPPRVFIHLPISSNPNSLAGGSTSTSPQRLYAIQPQVNAALFGDFIIEVIDATTSQVCSGSVDVCSACFVKCGCPQTSSPTILAPACWCDGFDAEDCMRTCVDQGNGNACN